jgi:hypothetical protein
MDKFLDKKSEAKIRERISTDCAGGNPTLPIPVALFPPECWRGVRKILATLLVNDFGWNYIFTYEKDSKMGSPHHSALALSLIDTTGSNCD